MGRRRKDSRSGMNNAGMSLVELIVVVAILSILASVVVAQFVRYIEKANKARDLYAAGEIASAYQTAVASNPEVWTLFEEWRDPSLHRNLHTRVTATTNGVTESYDVALIVASEKTYWTGTQSEYLDGFYDTMNEELGLDTGPGANNRSMRPRYKVQKTGPHSSGEAGRSYKVVDRWRIVERLDNGQVEVWTADDSKYGGWPQFRVWPQPDDVYTD